MSSAPLRCVVLGRDPSGESHLLLTLLEPTQGLERCLLRISRAKGATPPDLFDEAELWLESRSQGRTWFIKEYRHLARRPGIGRSYASLQAAARLARLVQRNPVPDESRGPVATLLRQALGALDAGAAPEVVWFKALYRFLREEGYPVKQQWWQGLADVDRTLAATVLQTTATATAADPAALAVLLGALEAWVANDTELRLG